MVKSERPSKLSRRQFLGLADLGAGALALGGYGILTTRERGTNPPAPGSAEYELEVAPMRLNLGGQEVSTWGYNGILPGPEIRIKAGQQLRATVHNRLPEETTR